MAIIMIFNDVFCNLAPHSPRRQKLNLRMKSLSLDSPESTEQIQRRRHVGQAGTSEPQSNHSSSSRIQCKYDTKIGEYWTEIHGRNSSSSLEM